MQQLQGASILALAVALGACSQASNDGAQPNAQANPNSSLQASLDREPPAFAAYVPPPQKAAALAAWREASFGLFLHFVVYSTFGGEYEGRRSGAYAEWLMQNTKIPVAEYRTKVAGVFNPTEFNADEWVLTAKAAGMRYMV